MMMILSYPRPYNTGAGTLVEEVSEITEVVEYRDGSSLVGVARV